MMYGDMHIKLLPNTLITLAISRLEKKINKINEPIFDERALYGGKNVRKNYNETTAHPMNNCNVICLI